MNKSKDDLGRFLVRMPRSLHRKLVQEAEREGVSLNTLCTAKIAAFVGAYEAAELAAYREVAALKKPKREIGFKPSKKSKRKK